MSTFSSTSGPPKRFHYVCKKKKKKLFIKSLDTYFAVLKVEQPFYIMERWREVTFALDKCFVCSLTVILVNCFVSFHSFDVRFDLECQFKDSNLIIVKHINCRCAKFILTRNLSFCAFFTCTGLLIFGGHVYRALSYYLWCILVMHDEPQDLKNVFLNIWRIYLTEHFYGISVIIKILRNVPNVFFFLPDTSLMLRLARLSLCTRSNPGDVTFPPLPPALNDSWFGMSIVKAHRFQSSPPRNHVACQSKYDLQTVRGSFQELLLLVWR